MSKWSAAFRDSRWQKLRLEVMDRDMWSCCACGKGENDGTVLNVHHTFYESGKAPWEYETSTLFTLCEACHKKIHEAQKKLQLDIMNAIQCCTLAENNDIFKTITGFIHAQYLGPAFDIEPIYCEGYYRGKLDIGEFDYVEFTKQEHVGVTFWGTRHG